MVIRFAYGHVLGATVARESTVGRFWMQRRALATCMLTVGWVVALAAPVSAKPAPAPQTLTVGVDWADPTNQQPNAGRVFEYTDFFSRGVRIRSGDTLDFHVAPGSFHIVALAKSEKVARKVYPVALADVDHHGA